MRVVWRTQRWVSVTLAAVLFVGACSTTDEGVEGGDNDGLVSDEELSTIRAVVAEDPNPIYADVDWSAWSDQQIRDFTDQYCSAIADTPQTQAEYERMVSDLFFTLTADYSVNEAAQISFLMNGGGELACANDLNRLREALDP